MLDRLYVYVSADDIKLGARRNCHYCPVALAIKRMFKNSYVAVTPTRVMIGDAHTLNRDAHYQLSARAVRLVKRFDKTGEMQPFGFVLKRVPPIN